MGGILSAALAALFGDYEETMIAKTKDLEKEFMPRRLENFIMRRSDEIKRRSDIAAQYLTGWDRNFFILRLADPHYSRNVFEDAVSELEEAAHIDPKMHLGIGMALTCYASQILAENEALIYLQKIVECYQKAVNEASENRYYRNCLEYATRELAGCTKEAVGQDPDNEHHPKPLKAISQANVKG